MEQFVALGYIDEVPDDPTEAAEGTRRENKWSLARAYLYTGKYEQALPLLEDCFTAVPERTDFAQSLARTQLHLGLTGEAEETLAICLETFGNSLSAHLLQALIDLQRGHYSNALAHLEKVSEHAPKHPQALELLCRCHVAVGQWEAARTCAETLLGLDPDSYQARITLARVALHHGKDYATAASHTLTAVSLQYGDPRGHAVLGQCLLHLRQLPEAETALLNCLRLDPENAPATRALAQVYRKMGAEEKALAAEAASARLVAKREAAKEEHLESLHSGAAARARERHAERQRKRAAAEKKTAEEAATPPCQFTIVSGLPRSGTSLMMQMLRSAGMDIMHDGKREADEDNLEGYWEWEEIKSLRKNPRLIEKANGKVIKVISALLPQLPPHHRYRIIFMKRPVEEIVASQWTMLARNGHKPRSERQHLIQTQQTHLDQTLARLRQHKNVELLEIDYSELVANPAKQIPALQDFLTLPHPEKLTFPIRPALHRQKTPTERCQKFFLKTKNKQNE